MEITSVFEWVRTLPLWVGYVSFFLWLFAKACWYGHKGKKDAWNDHLKESARNELARKGLIPPD